MSDRLDTLARYLVTRREAYEKAKKEADRLEKTYKETQADFWETMDDQGLTTFTADLGPGFGEIQFQKRETIRGIVKNPEKAAESLKEAGLEAELLGAPKVHQKVLSEHARDWLQSGQAFPEGVDFTATRYVSVTRK